MPYISLTRATNYLKGLKSTDRHEVQRLVSLACIHNFLEPDLNYIHDFHFQYCTVAKKFKEVNGVQFLIVNTIFTHDKALASRILPTSFVNKDKDNKPNQIIQVFPSKIDWTFADNDLQASYFLDKARILNDFYKSYKNIFKKTPFCTTHFISTDKFVTSKLSVKLACRVLMSDTPWCHQDALYLVSDLNYSIMQDFKVDPELDVEAVSSFEQGQIWTKFHYKNNIFAFMKGFPITMYWYDPWDHEDDEYTWKENIIELQKILNYISDDLKKINR